MTAVIVMKTMEIAILAHSHVISTKIKNTNQTYFSHMRASSRRIGGYFLCAKGW